MQHGKYWLAKFSPSDGDVRVFLASGEDHKAKLDIELGELKKITSEECNFQRSIHCGFQTFATLEQVAQSIDVNGTWTFIINIGTNVDQMES